MAGAVAVGEDEMGWDGMEWIRIRGLNREIT